MDGASAAELLARALRDDRLAALVGSGASATYTDPNGRTYDGLPTAREFVALAAKQYGYVHASDDFSRACDVILDRDKRSGLEDVLLTYYRVPEAIEPPPAHRLLSWLPFSLYVTSNYDQFIERSLEREAKRPYTVIDNEDLLRLKRWNTPVIKYHGCVTRPASLVAATPDYEQLDHRRTLVRQLLAVSLANKTLLVVGHGLSDGDLSRILNETLGNLSEYAPNILVIREPGHDGRLPGFTHPFELVAEDLTQFLDRLLLEYRALQRSDTAPVFDESWLTSAFFAQVRQAAVLPSETQVIDAFLTHLQSELGARDGVGTVVADARTAVDRALLERPNYGALLRTWETLEAPLQATIDPADAEDVVNQVLADRRRRVELFAALGKTLVKSNDRILLFSQSQRVLQALKGVPASVQRTCHLFVAECRPKSPQPYQDAAAICRELAATNYTITVCPDVVAVNLLATRQIDRVLLGTHALYVNDSADPVHSVHAAVNTCGSTAIVLAAQAFRVPVELIGESLKIEPVPSDAGEDHLHAHEENDLLQSAVGIRELRTRRGEVGHLNVGYDLLQVTGCVTVHIPDLDLQ